MCPRLGEMMPKGWGDNAQAVGNTSLCSFLYLVDYIVPYSYCKLTICSYIGRVKGFSRFAFKIFKFKQIRGCVISP